MIMIGERFMLSCIIVSFRYSCLYLYFSNIREYVFLLVLYGALITHENEYRTGLIVGQLQTIGL